jgi:hydrogenase maturation protease
MSQPVLVVGLGNSLMADDGVGLEVVRRLAEGALPSHARAEVAGADSLVLPSLWRGEKHLWLVDALQRGEAPGALHRLEHDEVLSLPQAHSGAHHLSLPESLRWIGVAYPEMTVVRYQLWGIEPADVEPRESLSPPVERAVSAVVKAMVSALHGEAHIEPGFP